MDRSIPGGRGPDAVRRGDVGTAATPSRPSLWLELARRWTGAAEGPPGERDGAPGSARRAETALRRPGGQGGRAWGFVPPAMARPEPIRRPFAQAR